ncbi:hypothetical protein M8C21_007679 [Ambrosia artemisiifolia]|uniref:Uncharacterized protein n=1 Tax=Ambrosia artemisiifolia TaxID=4212 RepID=A0AAD5GSF1_AMBAR|nr:hypothetical protein M8C21_007679 [Ambrosia artemisiifolia]
MMKMKAVVASGFVWAVVVVVAAVEVTVVKEGDEDDNREEDEDLSFGHSYSDCCQL